VLRAKRTPLSADARRSQVLPAGQAILVLGAAPSGWDRNWCAALAEGGSVVCEVLAGERAAQLAKTRFTVDFASDESVAQLHQLLAREGFRVGGVVNLLGLSEPFSRREACPGGSAERLVHALLNIAKEFEGELLQCSRDGGGRVFNLTTFGGSFGVGAQRPLPLAQAASLGLVKSLNYEWPGVRARNIDLDPTADPETLQAMVVAELLADHDALEVGLAAGERRTLSLEEQPIDPADQQPLDLDRQSVVLITGGARGITAEIAKAIAQASQCRLILLGRAEAPGDEDPALRGLADEQSLRSHFIARADARGPEALAAINRRVRQTLKDREVRANLAAIRASGASVEYHAVDVGRADEFARFIDDLYRRYGVIDGVIHGAGVIEDSRIRNKTAASAARVLAPKVHGADVLAARLKPQSLKFLALFSSVAGRFGNAGQADYAAANEYLNKLADELDGRWPARVLAINWGPWDRGVVPPQLAQRFREAGIPVIPAPLGVEAFMRELRARKHHTSEVVIGCGVHRLQQLAKGQ
jgi:NAD(P)-dependent dehydrogenase (short-subunit alcohol dehydrogenase family)